MHESRCQRPKFLTDKEKETIRLMAECSMNISTVSYMSRCSRKSIYERLRSIRNKTGKDPNYFWDLLALIEMIGEDE